MSSYTINEKEDYITTLNWPLGLASIIQFVNFNRDLKPILRWWCEFGQSRYTRQIPQPVQIHLTCYDNQRIPLASNQLQLHLSTVHLVPQSCPLRWIPKHHPGVLLLAIAISYNKLIHQAIEGQSPKSQSPHLQHPRGPFKCTQANGMEVCAASLELVHKTLKPLPCFAYGRAGVDHWRRWSGSWDKQCKC